MAARRVLAACLAAAMLALVAPAPSTAARGSALRWIVTLAPGTAMQPVMGEAERLGGRVGVSFSEVLLGFTFTGSRTAAQVLAANNANVLDVFPDGAVRLTDTDVAPSGVARTSAPAAHVDGLTGAGATVAIIDSGIDLTHPDLLANIHPTLGKNCLDPPHNLAPPQD